MQKCNYPVAVNIYFLLFYHHILKKSTFMLKLKNYYDIIFSEGVGKS